MSNATESHTLEITLGAQSETLVFEPEGNMVKVSHWWPNGMINNAGANGVGRVRTMTRAQARMKWRSALNAGWNRK